MTKRCPHCEEIKSRDEFHRHSKRADGLQSWCKVCFSERERTARVKARRTEIHERRWEEEPEYRKRVTRQRREGFDRYRNSPRGKAKRREYWLSGAGKRTGQRYRQSQKGKISMAVRHERRRATFEGDVSIEEWSTILGMYTDHRGTMCAYCYEIIENPTMDHINPISGGGRHEIENVVPACGSCNSSKGAKPLLRWMYDKQMAVA